MSYYLVMKWVFLIQILVILALEHNNFDEIDPDATILIRLLAQHIKFEKRKEVKKR